MPKKETRKQREQNEAYMENYRQLVQRLTFLSRFNVKQFMGTRQEEREAVPGYAARVDYMAGLESFKNLVNAQLSGIIRILTMMLGDKKQEFLKIMEEELGNELKSMEVELGVTGWTAEGKPQLDLQVLREKTKGWPA